MDIREAYRRDYKDRRAGRGYPRDYEQWNNDNLMIAYTNGRLAEAHCPGRAGYAWHLGTRHWCLQADVNTIERELRRWNQRT